MILANKIDDLADKTLVDRRLREEYSHRMPNQRTRRKKKVQCFLLSEEIRATDEVYKVQGVNRTEFIRNQVAAQIKALRVVVPVTLPLMVALLPAPIARAGQMEPVQQPAAIKHCTAILLWLTAPEAGGVNTWMAKNPFSALPSELFTFSVGQPMSNPLCYARGKDEG